jgi:hypothetical protein
MAERFLEREGLRDGQGVVDDPDADVAPTLS